MNRRLQWLIIVFYLHLFLLNHLHAININYILSLSLKLKISINHFSHIQRHNLLLINSFTLNVTHFSITMSIFCIAASRLLNCPWPWCQCSFEWPDPSSPGSRLITYRDSLPLPLYSLLLPFGLYSLRLAIPLKSALLPCALKSTLLPISL